MAKLHEARPGAVFDSLTVLAQHIKYREVFCLCACVCGAVKDVNMHHLGKRTGGVSSCGCARAASLQKHSSTHTHKLDSEAKQRTFRAWQDMWERTSPNALSRPSKYRKLTPPDCWKSFEKFLEDMGNCPENLTLERVDTRLPYGPDNCQWVTRAEQVKNREYTRFFCKGTEIVTMKELSTRLCLTSTGMRYRANRQLNLDGWTEVTYAEYVTHKKSAT